MSESLHAPDAEPVAVEALCAVAPEALAQARFTLDPSLGLLASPWPIDLIWQVSQADADPEAVVDLTAGGVRLAVRRIADEVVFHPLDAGRWALWQALLTGGTLAEAASAALATDPALDVSEAVADLLAQGLLAGVDVIAKEKSHDGTDDGPR
jgi:hypothetical protein